MTKEFYFDGGGAIHMKKKEPRIPVIMNGMVDPDEIGEEDE